MDEQQAIQRLKSGDIGGLEYLVRQYQARAVRTACLITRDPALAGVGAWFEGYNSAGGGGGGGDGTLNQSNLYEGPRPAGKLTLVLAIQQVRVPGPWSVTWQPDALPTGGPRTSPEACLTRDGLARLAPVQAELAGKILLYDQLQNGQDWGLTFSGLDGSASRVIASPGTWGALSPDGTRVAYSGQQGLVVLDLASGSIVPLGADGYSPRWSADGTRIAFVSASAPHVFIVSADGSGLRQVSLQAFAGTYVAGWSPDGQRVYVARPGGGSFVLKAVEVASGAELDLAELKDSSRKDPGAAISPDGAWVVYRSGGNDSLYLQRLDGSDWRIVALKPGDAVSDPAWSGGWLGVTVLKGENETSLFLLRPDTCQAFTLPGLHGYIEGLSMP